MIFLCSYCSTAPVLKSGDFVYPHRPDLYSLKFWVCESCGAHVGCHRNTETPLGRLANEELRDFKKNTHAAFDPIWKYGDMSRSEAYTWLSHQLGIPKGDCHIGMFDIEICKRTIDICREYHAVKN